MPLLKSSPLTLPTDEAALPSGVPIIGWHNLVTTGNISVTSAEANYPVTNLANPSTVLEWRATSTATQNITITFASQTVDYVAIARHNFTDATVAVKTPGLTTLVSTVVTNNEPLIFWFTAQALTGVVITITGATTTPRAAVVYAGKLLVCERSMDVGPEILIPRFARKTELVTGRSVRGDYLGSIVTSRFRAGMGIDFRHFTPDWYRSKFDPFLDAAQAHQPFFWQWEPVQYPLESAFVWLTDDPTPTTSPITGRVGVSLKVDGIRE